MTHFILVIAAMVFSGHLTAEPDHVVSFNIGGFHFATTASIIEHSDVEYLKACMAGHFAMPKDEKGRIFIGRAQEEGRILSTYLHTGLISEDARENFLRSTAEFFQIDSLAKLVEALFPKRSALLTLTFLTRSNFRCPNCQEKKLFGHATFLKHLLEAHRGQIIADELTYEFYGSPQRSVVYTIALPEGPQQLRK